MNELRRCPLRGHQVILAPERLVLPEPVPERAPQGAPCVLCPGGAASRWKRLGQRGQAFAVPNGRPVLHIEAQGGWTADGPFESREGLGAHEVLVLCDDHGLAPWRLPPAALADGLTLAQERMRDLRGDTRLRSLSWFMVHRAEAGARVDHPHAQLVALPDHGPAVLAELAAHRAWASRHGGSLSAAVLERELDSRRRVIAVDEGWVSLVPFAPSGSFECWILPTAPRAGLEDCTPAELHGLAWRLVDLLGRLHRALGDTPLRVVLRGVPEEPGYRLRLELLPVLDSPRGLTLATGCVELAVAPEDIARHLRELG